MKNINDEFGQVEELKEEVYKQPSISPFDFVNTINYSKDNLIVDKWSESQYNPYIVNKSLSFSPDTCIMANEMNSRPHLDKLLQYEFLINIVRKKKRFSKWIKSKKIEEIEVLKDYYNYNTDKARQALSILSTEHIEKIKERITIGGVNET